VKRLVIITLLALATLDARAQGASQAESEAVAQIADCLATGAPPDWRRLMMVVKLLEPGDQTGEVTYLAEREEAPDKFAPFDPCDASAPAKLLLEVRKHQAAGRETWIGARIILLRDGNFQLKYEYP
jgi:hypothetical protein